MNSNLKKFLVEKAEEFVNSHKEMISITQINNMIIMSKEACCIEEIENFIKYQIGRDKKKTNGWGQSKDILKIIKDIEKETISRYKNVNDHDITEAIMLFFGYLKRYRKYTEAEL